MATADDALNLARAQLGKGPQQFIAWYPAAYGTPWCMIFQSWVLTFSGAQDTHYAWVSGFFDAMRAEGRTLAPYMAQPGDLVAFDYDGRGRNNYDHVAMVESVDLDAGTMTCIDGNWQNRVQRVRRSFYTGGYAGGIAEIARPFYTTPPIPPTPIIEDDMARRFIRPQNSPNVYLADAGLLSKVHMTSEKVLADTAWALAQSGVPVLAPPAGVAVERINGVDVWVVADDFADAIPTN